MPTRAAPTRSAGTLWGVLGKPVAGQSRASLIPTRWRASGGNWDWDSLATGWPIPKKFAPGTKMTFAGLGNPEDRANVIAYLNARSGSPLPMPAAPAAAAPADGARRPPAAAAEKAAAETGRRRRAKGRNCR